MRSYKNLIALLVIAAAGIGGYIRYSSSPIAPANFAAAMHPPNVAQTTLQKPLLPTLQSASTSNASKQEPALLQGKATFFDIAAKLREFWQTDNNAYSMGMEFAAACGEGSTIRKRADRPGPATASDQYFVDWWSRFCAGSRLNELATLQAIDPPRSLLASTLYAAGGTPKPEAAQAALDAINSPNTTPADLKLAANYMTTSPDVRWDDGNADRIRGTPLDEKLPELQRNALKLVACDATGGCGPDEFYSVLECNTYRICAPGVTLQGVWSQVYSPIEYSTIVAIADGVRARRLR